MATQDQLKEEVRLAAEADLSVFIRLVAPHRVLGAVHHELIRWWAREDAKDHQLALLPRDHQKSALMAYRVAWRIVREPDITFLYISATRPLAKKQLQFIKSILTCKAVRTYWPDLLPYTEDGRLDESRTVWNTEEIEVTHPLRKEEGVRDATISTAGMTTNITGFHFKIVVLDDVVVQENAYTKEARDKVATLYSLLSSIGSTDTGKAGGLEEWVVGTRYFPTDLYNDLMTIEYEIYDDNGVVIETVPVYEVFERKVEDKGDGTGEFLWPRQRRADGKYFGFSESILSKKRAKYLDKMQFRAQYYNDPNDPAEQPVDSSRFQYYDKAKINFANGRWYFGDNRLNIFAAIDFAFSQSKRADYTAIVVIGVTSEGDIYILDIDRFRTSKISVYFDHLLRIHTKWAIRKLRAEVSVGQEVIVNELKALFKQNGTTISIDEFRPTRYGGSKEERIAATLEPRYDNMSIWHYLGGNCQLLEEELIYRRPAHDDIKDALAAAVAISVAPPKTERSLESIRPQLKYHSRFGGVMH